MKVGDLVLVFDNHIGESRKLQVKLMNQWYGPYCIREVPVDSTYYRLIELDGTELAESFAEDRLKCFFPRGNTAGTTVLPERNDVEFSRTVVEREVLDKIVVEPPPDDWRIY